MESETCCLRCRTPPPHQSSSRQIHPGCQILFALALSLTGNGGAGGYHATKSRRKPFAAFYLHSGKEEASTMERESGGGEPGSESQV